MSALDAAVQYARRGWKPIPIPTRSKNPGFSGWQQLYLDEADLPKHFNCKPQNIGILLGEPSGWLIDVDLDHSLAVQLAGEYLPHTAAVFGRTTKPKSHWLYRAAKPIETKKFRSPTAGMIVELRSTGAQTVFPPSIHELGEAIEWDGVAGEPALIDPEELLGALELLARVVRAEIGDVEVVDKPYRDTPPTSNSAAAHPQFSDPKLQCCLSHMLRINTVDKHDGSNRLFAVACRAVEHGLDDADALAVVREYARQRPFSRNWSDQELLHRIRDAEKKTKRGMASRPRVVIDTDEHRVVNETIQALEADVELYQRGGQLVRILHGSRTPDGIERGQEAPTIATVPQAALREKMTEHAAFIKFVKTGDGEVEMAAHPTPWLVGAVDARGDWPGIRRLNGISDVPILRPNGSLWQTSGYDPQTGVYYQPSAPFPQIPADVTLDDADYAVNALMEIVCDFRFEDDDHRAAWLASLLTPIARFAFDGPSPLFLVDANIRGAGKGLLVQTIGWTVMGREMPVSSYARDSEEMRKKITAIALAGDRMVHLDNLAGTFGNDALDRALTSTRWKDRILGKNELVDLPLHAVWYGTGNNVAVAADTTRRIIHIRLDVLEERPEERSDFRHPDLIHWIRENRPYLLMQALTILVAYFNAGCPRQKLSSFGSYEGWSRIVREAIVWAGLPDPCRTRTRLVELSDTTADALSQLIQAWEAYIGVGEAFVVSQLLPTLFGKDVMLNDEAIAMRNAVENFVGCAPGKVPSNRQFGNKLRSFRRRLSKGMYFDTNPHEPSRNGAVWRLHSDAKRM